MRYLTWLLLAATALWIGACGSQEQPPAPPAPPTVTAPPQTPPPAPEPTVPTAPAAAPTAPTASDKPAAVAAEPPAAPSPAPAPPPPPAKPNVQSAGVPDLITLESKQGRISFPHQAHARDYSCATCHGDGTPGSLALPMDVAHSLCRDCHKAKGAGPTSCSGCHKK